MQNIPQTPPDHIRERIEKFVSLVIKNGEGFIDYTRERQGNSGEVLFLNEGQPWNDYFNFQLYHLRNFGKNFRIFPYLTCVLRSILSRSTNAPTISPSANALTAPTPANDPATTILSDSPRTTATTIPSPSTTRTPPIIPKRTRWFKHDSYKLERFKRFRMFLKLTSDC